MKKPITFFLTFLALSILSCTSNPADDTAAIAKNLIGRWDLDYATKDGKNAPMLANAFFTFTNDNKMTTNLLGSDETSSYKLEGKTIAQKGGYIDVNYTIKSITPDSLTLNTHIRNVLFELNLYKKKE